jgi:hypothetical protein
MSITLSDFIEAIELGRPFSFSRWGDGEFAALFGDAGANCDGVKYAPDMVTELAAILNSRPRYTIGKQPYHPLNYTRERIAQIEALGLKWANADVFHDASKAGKLKPFLKALEGREVTIIGNPRLRKLETFFDFDFVDVHGNDAWSQRHELLAKVPKRGIVMFAAGITSNWLIDKAHGNGATLIDIGSLLDPFVGDRTRNYHKGVDARQATPVHVTMATVPKRERFAIQAIQSLLKNRMRPDTFHVELNGYTEAPEWLAELPVTYTVRPHNSGAKAKFARLSQVKGYYLTVDDDIAFPIDYIERLTAAIEKYGRKSLVGIHGSTHSPTPIKSYWSSVAKKHHFQKGLGRDTICSMLGTGTLGFHTSIGLTTDIFDRPNMTDPYLSLWANTNRIAQVALARPNNYTRQIGGSQDTGGEIWRSVIGNDSEQTEIINSIPQYFLPKI